MAVLKAFAEQLVNLTVKEVNELAYMDANGAMVSNTEMVIDGRTYRFAANGAMMY